MGNPVQAVLFSSRVIFKCFEAYQGRNISFPINNRWNFLSFEKWSCFVGHGVMEFEHIGAGMLLERLVLYAQAE